jgi:hypothetical protein
MFVAPKKNFDWSSAGLLCDHDSMPIGTQPADLRRKIALHVLLRLTRMDVCCGPPAVSST